MSTFDSQTNTILTSLIEVIQDLQHRLEKFEKQAEKIASIETNVNLMACKIENIEKKLDFFTCRTSELEENCENIGQVMHKVVDKCKENITNISNLETTLLQQQEHTNTMKSKLENNKYEIAELKLRSMATNLIVTGIGYSPEENAENKIKSFIQDSLEIDKAINFVSVHRFGKRGRRGNRPILVKFVSAIDKGMVLKNSFKLKRTPFRFLEQFPKEIEQKRKELYPVAKQARKEKRKVLLIRDHLYIDGNVYISNADTGEQVNTITNSTYSTSLPCIHPNYKSNVPTNVKIKETPRDLSPSEQTVRRFRNHTVTNTENLHLNINHT